VSNLNLVGGVPWKVNAEDPKEDGEDLGETALNTIDKAFPGFKEQFSTIEFTPEINKEDCYSIETVKSGMNKYMQAAYTDKKVLDKDKYNAAVAARVKKEKEIKENILISILVSCILGDIPRVLKEYEKYIKQFSMIDLSTRYGIPATLSNINIVVELINNLKGKFLVSNKEYNRRESKQLSYLERTSNKFYLPINFPDAEDKFVTFNDLAGHCETIMAGRAL